MDDAVFLEAIGNMTSELVKLNDMSHYTTVGFTTQSAGLNPLKAMLTEIIGKNSEEIKKLREAEKLDSIIDSKDSEKKSKQFDAIIDTLKGLQKKAEEEKQESNNKNSTINQYYKNALESWKNGGKDTPGTLKKIGAGIFQTVMITKDILHTTTAILKNMSTVMLTNMNFATDLRAAGVKISEGFDAGFIKYADAAGRSREEFVNLLRENSQFIASANAAGLNGTKIVSTQMGKLFGKMGITAREAEESIKAYNESMMTAANQANIDRINHTNEVIKSTEALKMFAMATGQSYENLIKEQKEKQKTWQMQRLATDPKTRAQFAALKNIGLSDDMIEAIMLGKANKASVMASLDPYSARMLNDMRGSYMRTINNPKQFMRELARISNSSNAQGMRNKEARINPADYAYINGLAELFAPGSTQWGRLVNGRLRLNAEGDLYDEEAQAMNTVAEAEKNLTVALNDLKDAVSPSLKTIASLYPKMTGLVAGLSNMVSWVLTSTGPLGKGLVAGGLAIQMLAPIANSITPFIVMHYASKLFKGFGATKVGTEMATAFATASTKTGGFIAKHNIFLTKHLKWLGKIINSGIGKFLGVVGLLGEAANTYEDFSEGNKKAGWGRIIGGLVGGAAGFIFGGGPAGAILGANIGAMAGGWLGGLGDDKKTENAPANANRASQYGNSVNSYNEDASPIANVSTTPSVITVNGIDGLRSLLREINSNTKAILTELRTKGMYTGTNMVTA